jgi:diguanylate cyclase (GGDEF)-like protein
VERSDRDPEVDGRPEDRRIRLTTRLLAVSFALLIVAIVAELVVAPDPRAVASAFLLLLVAGAAGLHVRALAAREHRRQADAESVTRLLRGLSRSVSPDAIVGAIAGELAPGAEADHVVVIRLRGEPPRLDATLVSNRPGIPSATTQLPLADLDDPGEALGRRSATPRPVPVAADGLPARGRRGATLTAAVAALRTVPARRPAGRPGAGARPAVRTATVAQARLASAAAGPSPSAAGRSTVAADAAPVGRAAASARGARGNLPRRGEQERRQRVADHLAARAASAFGLRTTLAAPLVVDGAVAGALVLSRRTAEPWPASSRRRLDEAATEASVALERARSYQAAETRASTDALTGLPNRRYFDEFCGLLARRRRSGDAVGVLMIDVDHFKRLNDRHGHAVGDEVLRAVGGALVASVREEDVPARYGGEEFVVLLRDPGPGVAADIGERVRRAVADLDLSEQGVAGVTVSVGVAVQRSADQAVADLLAEADEALYRAKRAGRDRVAMA